MPTISERILKVLGSSPLPVPTSDLVALCGDGLKNPRSRVWQVLDRLETKGVIARAHWRKKLHENGSGSVKELLWVMET